MKTCLAAMTFFVFALMASGQEEAVTAEPDLLDPIVRMTRSDSSEVRAWGAYLAGHHRLAEAAPALCTILHPPAPGAGAAPNTVSKSAADAASKKGGDLDYIRYAALHALITLDVPVPAAKLISLPAHFNSQVFLLLARDAVRNREALLDLAREKRSGFVTLMAVCNTLVPLKSPGAAALLLGRIELKLDISVYDKGHLGDIFGASGGRHGDSFFRNPKGFPPLVHYHLYERPRPGATVVAPGKFPIYCLRRTVEPGKTAGFDSFMRSGPGRNDYLLHCLALLAGLDEEKLGLDPEQHRKVFWSDAASMRDAVASARSKMATEFFALADLYRERGLLTVDEANILNPVIGVKISDMRKDKTEPLPDC